MFAEDRAKVSTWTDPGYVILRTNSRFATVNISPIQDFLILKLFI